MHTSYYRGIALNYEAREMEHPEDIQQYCRKKYTEYLQCICPTETEEDEYTDIGSDTYHGRNAFSWFPCYYCFVW